MKKQLIALLTCALSLSLYGKHNKELSDAIRSANLTKFNDLFAHNQASVNDTYVFMGSDSPVLHIAIEAYLTRTTRANNNIKKMIEFLLENGASINQADETGMTALHLAAYSNVVPMFQQAGEIKELGALVTLLLKYGANPNIQDKLGRTPLHLATYRTESASPTIVKLLLDHGANPDSKDSDGLTPHTELDRLETLTADEIKIKEIFDTDFKTHGLRKVINAEKERPQRSFKDFSVKFE